jgi:hypothetical protein
VDPGIVQRDASLPIGEVVGVEREDGEGQAADEQQARRPGPVSSVKARALAHITPRYIPPSTSRLTPVM